MSDLLKPKTVHITTEDGDVRTYNLGRIPYKPDGRKIITQFIPTAVPKVGSYDENDKLSDILFKYIEAVPVDGGKPVRLVTSGLVNNHVPDGKTGLTLEKEMLQHNAFFLSDASLSTFSGVLSQMFQQLTTQMLTALKPQSSVKDSQPPTS